MRTVNNLLQATKQLELSILQNEAMASGTDVYVSQQKEQLFDGIGGNGKDITPPYAYATVVIKSMKGQPYDRVTLKDTGSFYEGIYADPKGDKMYIDSRDSKSNALQEKYGDEVFGLSGTYRQPYLEVVEENLITSVRKLLRI